MPSAHRAARPPVLLGTLLVGAGLAVAANLPGVASPSVGPASSGVARSVSAQEVVPPSVYLPVAAKHAAAYATRPPATVTPSLEPSATATGTPTETPTPAATETPTETPTITPSPTLEGPEWLRYVAFHRALAGLPPVTENEEWSRGGELHAKYMVKNNVIGHSESPARPHYTAEGDEAARNGNVYLAAATNYEYTYRDAIDGWMTGPFHMLGIIDPKLEVSGFGEYAEVFDRMRRYGATLDVHRGRTGTAQDVRFPLYYPRDGEVMPNLSYEGGESPDPLATCSGYTVPTGPPIVLQLGTGDITPSVRRVTLRDESGADQALCWYDETRYKTAPGSITLDLHDAIVVMPRQPLEAGEGYRVTIELASETHAWSFTAANGGRPQPGAVPHRGGHARVR